MKELYMIMSDLLELEYNQKSLWYILDALAGGYDERQKEAMITNSTRYYLTGLQAELRVAINRLDAYIAERKKTWKMPENLPGKPAAKHNRLKRNRHFL